MAVNVHTPISISARGYTYMLCTQAHCSQCKQRTLHTKRLLQTLHMFLCNLCKRHSLKKDLPGGGWRPCPPLHLVRPACTASSSSRGWLLKQTSIVSVRSPTPSRTALPFVAALLLTYFLKSLRWSEWSAEKAQHFTAHSSQVTELTKRYTCKASVLHTMPEVLPPAGSKCATQVHLTLY